MINIFEFLGLPKNHRKGIHITQHVKHFNEVPESKIIWPMLGQVKLDGVYAMIVKIHGKIGIFSRTGKHFTNLERLEKKMKESNMPDRVIYVAELCNDSCSLETLSGIVNPNRKRALTEKQKVLTMTMYLAFHDAVPVPSFIEGYYSVSYPERYIWLYSHLPECFTIIESMYLPDKKYAQEYAQARIKDGEEGVVFKQFDTCMSDWKAGHKGYRMMKKVRGVDYDLLCIGAEEGKGKYKGLVANLIFKWKNGKEIKCMLGKGWTHLEAENMWADYKQPGTGAPSPVGNIFQVYALQESSKGKLRLPKVGELRTDKDEPDIKEV